MKPSINVNRLLAAGVLVAAAVVSPAAVAYAGPGGPALPTDLVVPDGNKLFRVGHAVGVQIYSCNATPNGAAWTFVAPRADLYDDHGKLVMTHSAGPTWQARDGSRVVGRREAAVTVDRTAIDWLKLSAASTSPGLDGDQMLHTTWIQRLATSGGIAPPAGGCASDTIGTRAEVAYTADYYFWKAQNE